MKFGFKSEMGKNRKKMVILSYTLIQCLFINDSSIRMLPSFQISLMNAIGCLEFVMDMERKDI